MQALLGCWNTRVSKQISILPGELPVKMGEVDISQLTIIQSQIVPWLPKENYRCHANIMMGFWPILQVRFELLSN